MKPNVRMGAQGEGLGQALNFSLGRAPTIPPHCCNRQRALGLLRGTLAIWFCGCLAQAGLGAAQTQPATGEEYAKAGPAAVETVRYTWHDAARNRDVPVLIYYPKVGTGPFPVIIFSHGLGGSREGYSYVGNHWASHGYVCVHPTHAGSDGAAVVSGGAIGAGIKAAIDPQNAIARPKDITFVIDQLTVYNQKDATLKGRLDLDKIGVAGHSFGGFTALASAGETFVLPGGVERSLGNARVKAAIAMSAPAQPQAATTLDKMYGSIKIPCLNMTGTADESPIGETHPADRRIPFDHMPGPDDYLLTFKDGDHMVFGGHPRLVGNTERDRRYQRLILMSSTAFWDAYLRNDAPAKAFLAETGFSQRLGADGTFEKKGTK